MRMGWMAAMIGAALMAGQAPAVDDGYALIPVSARKTAPDFSLTDVQGKPLTLRQFRGKIVLLDFWAVDCGGCRIEIPWYVEFDRKYRAQGLQLVGLDMYGESLDKIRPFMAKAGMDYPVAVGNDALGAQYGVEAMPLTLLIDREGRVAVSHAGIVDRAAFERDVEEVLR
ncbi:MAG TPA: redoxin domain-containing protein [Acidobacteriaceae bacterium]|jgi:peroxiredoxin|nr:redoxin domain-containing protein [Acidobacteriaceae bacterium]